MGVDWFSTWVPVQSGRHVGVSENSGTPKSSVLIGFSIINHPFWGTPIFGNTHVENRWIFGKLMKIGCSDS